MRQDHPVDWWFVFKFNAKVFPACGGEQRVCLFGGAVQNYKFYGQQFVYASSSDSSLQKGSGCAGDSVQDPLGATFDQVYSQSGFYVIWNDQFYDDPKIQGCTTACGAPWAHSKGMVAWDSDGNGFVLQVTTPSWPAAGSNNYPRKTDGNTLGCVRDDNVEVSQHFFALRLNEKDLVDLLAALKNAGVVTDPHNSQVVRNGGPQAVQALVGGLGTKSTAKTVIRATLSTGVQVISKPPSLHVPPWQLVSAELGGVDLRTATWWASPRIESTTAASSIGCWDASLPQPGAVENSTSGHWDGKTFGLLGGLGPDFNHAKIGVSTSGDHPYVIFGDMNQQGDISGLRCGSSQNGRGGLFFVLENAVLLQDVRDLISISVPIPRLRPGDLQ